MTQRIAVLTGGPGAGKTTLLDALAARGHAVVPEAAILVIGELIEQLGGVQPCREWRTTHLAEFQLRIARMQAQLEADVRATGAPLIFCDRGLIDGLAYLERQGVAAPPGLSELLADAQYDVVFLLATLSEFTDRPDSGRISTQADSLELSEGLRQAYGARGYRVIDVEEASVQRRADQVLEALV